ncbi:gamma-glutamyl-gamma-aminobutyrate hydrolase family protein [Streptomyces sp. NPDC048504]|uniref:gamma-glutamyl-gamma-aminobutyrate hydrolase family protein n=1 Tax=Streptomyces sp. NPDC048504 TaxID=3365559 RepID=UPI00371EAC41
MGGAMAACADFLSRGAELALLRAVLETEIPVFGVCLGAQLLVVAAGGLPGPATALRERAGFTAPGGTLLLFRPTAAPRPGRPPRRGEPPPRPANGRLGPVPLRGRPASLPGPRASRIAGWSEPAVGNHVAENDLAG